MLLHRNPACFSTDFAGLSQATATVCRQVCRCCLFSLEPLKPLVRDTTDSFVETIWQESMWDYASNPFDGDHSYFTRAGGMEDEI